MSRPKNPKRDKAYKMWEKSGRTATPKDIAGMLDVSASLVSKWKSADKWEEKSLPNVGAPKGNKNADGNRGGKGAPERNTHAEIHGAYSKMHYDILFDSLDEEERALIDSVTLDVEQILLMQLQELVIQARRFKRHIKALEAERGGRVLEGKIIERTPRGEKTVTYTASVFNRIMSLEAGLNRTQGRIIKVGETIMRYRNEHERLGIEQERLKLFKMKALGIIDMDLDDVDKDDFIDVESLFNE